MIIRFIFTSIALSSVVLTAGVVEVSANAESPIAAKKSSSLVPLPAASMTNPIYIAQSTTSPASLEQAVHTQVNQYRASLGLPPLALDSRISNQARTHSQNMANGVVPFSHDGFQARIQELAKVITLRAAAENVAYNQGYRDPATQAVQGWLKSTGHLSNIKANYNLTGIGIAKNSQGKYYFTQIFIRSN